MFTAWASLYEWKFPFFARVAEKTCLRSPFGQWKPQDRSKFCGGLQNSFTKLFSFLGEKDVGHWSDKAASLHRYSNADIFEAEMNQWPMTLRLLIFWERLFFKVSITILSCDFLCLKFLFFNFCFWPSVGCFGPSNWFMRTDSLVEQKGPTETSHKRSPREATIKKSLKIFSSNAISPFIYKLSNVS